MGKRLTLWACFVLAASICGLFEVSIAQTTAAPTNPAPAASTPAPTGPPAPTNLQFPTVGTDSLVVTWSGSAATYKVTHQAAEESSETEFETATAAATRTVTGLSPGTLYTIRVYGISSAGVQGAPLEGTQRTRPLPPTNLVFSELGIDPTIQINVSWNASQTACVDAYELTYEAPKTGVVTVNRTDSSSTSEVISEGLVPGTVYSIGVYAVCDGTVQSDSLDGEKRTQADQPTDLREISANTTAVTVTWMAPSLGEFSGSEVSYKIAGSSDSQMTIPIGNWNITQATLPNLTPGQLYDVEVVSVSGMSRSQPASNQFRTIPISPGDINTPGYDMVTTTNIPVTWGASVGGVLSGYEVIYTPEGGEALTAVKVDNETTTASSAVDLVPGKLYDITVYTVSGMDENRKKSDNKSITVRTFPKPPDNLQSTVVLRELRVDLTWDKPDGEVDTYEVKVFKPSESVPVKGTNYTQMMASIEILEANQEYRFDVYSISGTRRSKEASSVTNKTDKAAPDPATSPGLQNPAPKPTSTGTKQFTVPLDPSVFDSPNGDIAVFSILVQEYNKVSPDSLAQGESPLTWYNVTNPPDNNPNQRYKFYKATEVPGSSRRRRRSTTDVPIQVPIGTDSISDCNHTTYCNGPLKPDTQYRYIIQGCTQSCDNGPCTPQNPQDPYYCSQIIVSEAIRTAAEQNPVPIIIGVVVAVVLIALIAGAIFWYRRKHK